MGIRCLFMIMDMVKSTGRLSLARFLKFRLIYLRYHDSWGWGICDILVPSEFINEDTLTIVCEMTIPGNDVTRLGYTYNDAKSSPRKDESSKLVTDMERLLETSTLTDVTIKCENKILECHKVVLVYLFLLLKPDTLGYPQRQIQRF